MIQYAGSLCVCAMSSACAYSCHNLTARAQAYLYVHPDSVVNSVKAYRLLSIITEGSRNHFQSKLSHSISKHWNRQRTLRGLLLEMPLMKTRWIPLHEPITSSYKRQIQVNLNSAADDMYRSLQTMHSSTDSHPYHFFHNLTNSPTD